MRKAFFIAATLFGFSQASWAVPTPIYSVLTDKGIAGEDIFIFGPGEAKGELRKHFHKHNLCGLIVGFETADKMTKRQVIQKVRNFYVASPAIPLTNREATFAR